MQVVQVWWDYCDMITLCFAVTKWLETNTNPDQFQLCTTQDVVVCWTKNRVRALIIFGTRHADTVDVYCNYLHSIIFPDECTNKTMTVYNTE